MSALDRQRRVQGRPGRDDHRRLQRERHRHRHAALALNSGGTASYSGGCGGSTLSFTYNVGAGENAADLDYSATDVAHPERRHDQGRRHQQRDAHAARPSAAPTRSAARRTSSSTPTNPTATVTTPASNGLTYNNSTLPGSLAGSSNDTGGSPPSRASISRSRTARATTGAAPPSTRPHHLQRHRRHRRRLDVLHRHARRPAHERPHLHDHRPLHRRRRQHRHDDPHLRLRHGGADRHERHSSTANGGYTAGAASRSQVAFSENVTVTGTPLLALTPAARRLRRRLGRLDARRSTTPSAPATTRRPRLHRHELAHPERRHDQGRSHERCDPDARDAGRRRLALGEQEHPHRHDGSERRLGLGLECERRLQGRPDDPRPGDLLRERRRHRHAEAHPEHRRRRAPPTTRAGRAARRSPSTTPSRPATRSPTSTTRRPAPSR